MPVRVMNGGEPAWVVDVTKDKGFARAKPAEESGIKGGAALTSPDAERQLTRLIEEGGTKLLVNFEKLEYISSAGLRILLIVAKQLKTADGELRVCGLNDVVKEVFDISGFDMILPISASESEALEGF